MKKRKMTDSSNGLTVSQIKDMLDDNCISHRHEYFPETLRDELSHICNKKAEKTIVEYKKSFKKESKGMIRFKENKYNDDFLTFQEMYEHNRKQG